MWLRDYVHNAGQPGAMTDAAKRGRDDVESYSGDTPTSTTCWKFVGSPVSEPSIPDVYAPSTSATTPMVSATDVMVISKYMPDIFTKENPKIPLPHDCPNLDSWSETQVHMKKYEHRGFRYASMVAAAMKDEEIHGYLSWLVKTYGKDIEKPCTNQATDFARFLLRINWLTMFPMKKSGGYQRSR